MERRFVLFIALTFAILMGHGWLMSKLNPPPPNAPAVAEKAGGKEAAGDKGPGAKIPGAKPGAEKAAVEKPAEKPGDKIAGAKVAAEKPEAASKVAGKPADKAAAAKVAAEKPLPEKWVSLGSADPNDPYRMLVTLTNRGAAVVRIELNSPKYRAIDDDTVPPAIGKHVDVGYLGHLVMYDDRQVNGCKVDVVGPGTPAAKAGLEPGDVITQLDKLPVITELDKMPVAGGKSLDLALAKTRAGRMAMLTVLRSGRSLELPVVLGHRPVEIVRPEQHDPLSFLMTLQQVDDKKLEGLEKVVDPAKPRELDGVALREATWEIAPQQVKDAVTFRRSLKDLGLEVTKTYRVVPVPAEKQADGDFKAYHIVVDVAVTNIEKVGGPKHTVAYQLDGPTGLPTEGWWYANKISLNASSWGAAGMRDVVVSLNQQPPSMVECPKVADDQFGPAWEGEPVTFLGIDAQYFSAMMIPAPATAKEIAQSQPLRVHMLDDQQKQANPDWRKVMDTSCRVVSVARDLEPNAHVEHHYEIFAGPKRPALLEQYGLGHVIYYGWFHWVGIPMVSTLHFFYAIVRNYGLAVILLTVLVRLCMFPMSKKQALGQAKMQQIQPELKKLQEKYKSNVEAKTKAQQELFRKHNYNPLSGCLPVFIQLPIFVALYRGLMVDVELRQAPLITEGVRWCSNLAGPDMLFDWRAYMPTMVTSGMGFFGLGPYFNILPIFTIILFLWQQKKMMPPPADEQAAAQQKVMKFMMIFMGLLFFKVASGLCIYFIASSLWGMAERTFLPKFSHDTPPESHGRKSGAKRRIVVLASNLWRMAERKFSPKSTRDTPPDRNGGSSGSKRPTRGSK